MKKKILNGLSVFTRLMTNMDTSPLTAEDRTHESCKMWIMYDRLTTGKLDDTGYITLTEYILTALHLAKILHELGSAEAQEYTNAYHDDLENAAFALTSVGVRKRSRKVEHYVAAGHELQQIRFAIELHDLFMRKGTRGHLATAKRNAAEMISSKLLKVWKATSKEEAYAAG